MNRKFTNHLFCLVVLAATLSFNQARAITYYWKGSSSTNWTTASNWSTSATGSPTAVTYPGLVAGDIAVLGYNGNTNSGFGGSTSTINLTANLLLLSQIQVPDNHNVILNLKSNTAFTLAVPSGITAGSSTGSPTGSELYLYSTGTATCSMSISGASVIGINTLVADYSVPATFNGPASSTSLSLTGASSIGASLFTNYTTVNAVCTFNLTTYSQIQNYGTFNSNSGSIFNYLSSSTYLTSIYNNTYDPSTSIKYLGIFNANGTTFNLAGTSPEIHNQSGTFNLNSGSIINVGGSAGKIYCNSDYIACTFNATSATINATGTSSIINVYASSYPSNFNLNASTINLSGTSSELQVYSYNKAATFTSTATSAINLTGSSSFINNDAYGTTSNIDLVGTTVNLGTATSNGASSSIQNTDQAVFHLDDNSVINVYGSAAKINNTYTTVGATKYYGMFYCEPTTVINLLNTSSVMNNDAPNNCFTLLSDNTGAATIGALTGSASITGTYDVQRYMTAGSNSYRNYRLLSSPVNKKQTAPGSGNNIDLSYLGATASPYYTGFWPTTYYGAFIAGPGSGFGATPLHATTNPIIYLYRESITPGANYNKAFTAGKNVGINAINTSSPYTVTTVSTATGKTTSDNSSGVSIPAGNGYILYYIGNNQRANTSNTVLPVASNVTASGYINQGSIPVYMWGTTPTTALTYTTTTGYRDAGMTMLGNPYPSTIDLHTFYNENSSVLTGMFYELNSQTQQFPTYNGSSNTVSASPTGGSEYIASGQGFYAVMSKAGTLTFNEDQKTASTTAPVFPSQSLASVTTKPAKSANSTTEKNIANDALISKKITDATAAVPAKPAHPVLLAVDSSTTTRKAIVDNAPAPQIIKSSTTIMPVPVASPVVSSVVPAATVTSTSPVNPAGLHLKLSQDSTNYDEIGIYFNPAWSDNFDKYDSQDLDGLAPKVYLSSFTADGVRVSINAMGDYKKGKKVKLYVAAVADGTYALNLEDIASIDTNNYTVSLIDTKLADTVSLLSKKPYSFSLSVADTAAASNRFVLYIAAKPLPPYQLLSFSGQKVSSGVQLNWKTVNESNYTGFLVQKQQNGAFVTIDTLTSDSAASYNFVDQHPALGSNVYRLEQVIAPDSLVAYSSLVTIGYNTTAPDGGGSLTIYPNPSKTIINISMAASSTNVPNLVQDIYNTSGVLVAHQTVSTATWTQDVSSYKLGVYVLQLKDTNGNVVGQSKFIKVN